ncbi:hypothetical protein ACWKWU_12905 [Chitinophaga lutea]
MKLFFLLAACSILTLAARAQQDEEVLLKATRISSSNLPPEVVAAYKAKFPNANLKDIVKLPTKVYKKDWEIDESSRPTGNEEYYSLYLDGDDIRLEALYDAKGNLIRANEVAKNVALPHNAAEYIVKHYKGYMVSKDRVKRLIEPNSIQAEWEVTITKGKNTKRLLFDTNGDFKKEK